MAGLRSVISDYGAAMVCAVAVSACWAPMWGARETLELGGGAGLIAYLVLLVALGLPWLWLELTIGSCFHCGLTEKWRRTARRWEWLGWWAALLALALALVALAVAATSTMQSIRGVGMLAGGVQDVKTPLRETASPIPQGPAVALCIAGLVGVVWLLNAGVAQAIRWVMVVAAVGAAAAVVAFGSGLWLPAVRGTVLHVLTVDFSLWLQLELWVAAAGWALLSILPAFGMYAVLISRRQRMVDTGGASILIVLAVGFGGILSAMLTCVPDGLAIGRDPSATLIGPLLLEPYRGVLGGSSPWALVSTSAACIAWAAWAAVTAVLLFAVVGDAGQRVGTATQRGFPVHFTLLVGACIFVISDQGLWWMQMLLMVMALVAIPLLVALSARGLSQARVLPGLIDYAQAHSSIGIQFLMTPWLRWLTPVGAALIIVEAGLLVFYYWQSHPIAAVDILAVGSVVMLIGGAALSGRWIANVGRIEPARLPSYVAVAMGGGLALLIAVSLAIGVESAERRYLRSGFATAVEAQAEGLATDARGDQQALLRLARQAWAAGDRALAWHSLTLWTATSPPERVTAAAAWTGELVVQAETAIRSEPEPDVDTALAVLGLLRALGAKEALVTVKEGWLRNMSAVPREHLDAANNQLVDIIDENGRVDAVALRQAERHWLAFQAYGEGTADVILWTYAPDPLGPAAEQIVAKVRSLIADGAGRYLPPTEAEAIASLALTTGLVSHVTDEQQMWIGETLAGSVEPGSAFIFIAVFLIVGAWTLAVTLTRVVRGPAPIDPHADTLLHVDPIDVDTQAVTAEGAYSTDGATTGSHAKVVDTNIDTESDTVPIVTNNL